MAPEVRIEGPLDSKSSEPKLEGARLRRRASASLGSVARGAPRSGGRIARCAEVLRRRRPPVLRKERDLGGAGALAYSVTTRGRRKWARAEVCVVKFRQHET